MLPKRTPTPSKVTAEERRLEREEMELLKKEAELKRQLKNLPKQIEQKKAKENRRHTMLNVTATTVDLRGARPLGSFGQAERRRKTPKRELTSAKVRFMVLLTILLTILVMLWRAVPS